MLLSSRTSRSTSRALSVAAILLIARLSVSCEHIPSWSHGLTSGDIRTPISSGPEWTSSAPSQTLHSPINKLPHIPPPLVYTTPTPAVPAPITILVPTTTPNILSHLVTPSSNDHPAPTDPIIDTTGDVSRDKTSTIAAQGHTSTVVISPSTPGVGKSAASNIRADGHSIVVSEVVDLNSGIPSPTSPSNSLTTSSTLSFSGTYDTTTTEPSVGVGPPEKNSTGTSDSGVTNDAWGSRLVMAGHVKLLEVSFGVIIVLFSLL